MDSITYTKKPLQLTGVEFDGSLSSARSIQDWVQEVTGLAAVLAPTDTGYVLYVPSVSGTNLLTAGMTLLMDAGAPGVPQFYPITAEELERNYDESEPGTEPTA